MTLGSVAPSDEDSDVQLRLVLPFLALGLGCAPAERVPPQAPPVEPPPPPDAPSQVEAPSDTNSRPASEELADTPERAEVASTFQFPTEGYAAGSTHGRRFLRPSNHLGDDSTHEHLARVVAIGNGVVRHVKRGGVKGYGSVTAVEHRLPDGELVVSIYGHLCNHDGYQIAVDVGDIVTKGALLGHIGDDDENGHGPEHIHLGIRRGEYDGALCGYVGPRHCPVSRFYDPTEFITARLSPP